MFAFRCPSYVYMAESICRFQNKRVIKSFPLGIFSNNVQSFCMIPPYFQLPYARNIRCLCSFVVKCNIQLKDVTSCILFYTRSTCLPIACVKQFYFDASIMGSYNNKSVSNFLPLSILKLCKFLS